MIRILEDTTYASKGEVGFDRATNEVRNGGGSDERLTLAILQHCLRTSRTFNYHGSHIVLSNGDGPCVQVQIDNARVRTSICERKMVGETSRPLLN